MRACSRQQQCVFLKDLCTASSKRFLPSMSANISARSRPVAESMLVAMVPSMSSCCFHLGSGRGTRADKNRDGIIAVSVSTLSHPK